MKTIWLNLPVKNIKKSKEFFKTIGFEENPMHKNAKHIGSFFIGENNFVLMLFLENDFKAFIKNEVGNTQEGTEMLINVDAQSREEVDEMAVIVRKAGSKIFSEPSESQGWMYGFGFEDLDGHRWSMLYMNMEKIPQ